MDMCLVLRVVHLGPDVPRTCPQCLAGKYVRPLFVLVGRSPGSEQVLKDPALLPHRTSVEAALFVPGIAPGHSVRCTGYALPSSQWLVHFVATLSRTFTGLASLGMRPARAAQHGVVGWSDSNRLGIRTCSPRCLRQLLGFLSLEPLRVGVLILYHHRKFVPASLDVRRCGRCAAAEMTPSASWSPSASWAPSVPSLWLAHLGSVAPGS